MEKVNSSIWGVKCTGQQIRCSFYWSVQLLNSLAVNFLFFPKLQSSERKKVVSSVAYELVIDKKLNLLLNDCINF